MPLPELPELEELYRLYRADLYRYLCHLTHDPTEAEDLLSETFLRALKRLHTYRGDCAVKTWLFGIARNVWLEGLRKAHALPPAPTTCWKACLAEDTLTGAHGQPPAMAAGDRQLLQQKDDRARRVVQLRAHRLQLCRDRRASWASAKVRLASSSTAPAPG